MAERKSENGNISTTTSFNFDRRTLDVLDRLKEHLHASSRVEVIRRALAFLDVAVEGSNGDPVVIQTKDGPIRIVL